VPEFTEVKHDGNNQVFETGSKRSSQVGKGRYDLIPPISLRRLAQHYENGARIYSERNWEKGQPLSRYLNSAMRHMQNILEGDTSEDHMAAAAWNVFALIHTQEMVRKGKLPAELDDLPKQDIVIKMQAATVSFQGQLFEETDVDLIPVRCEFTLQTGERCQLHDGHKENHAF
jgi:hypothetical protein